MRRSPPLAPGARNHVTERGKIKRGKYIGRRVDKPTEANAGDLEQCPGCGERFNAADLGEVFEHAHRPIPVRIKPRRKSQEQ